MSYAEIESQFLRAKGEKNNLFYDSEQKITNNLAVPVILRTLSKNLISVSDVWSAKRYKARQRAYLRNIIAQRYFRVQIGNCHHRKSTSKPLPLRILAGSLLLSSLKEMQNF